MGIHSRFFRLTFCPGYLWINEENHDKIEAHETDCIEKWNLVQEKNQPVEDEDEDW